MGGSAGAAIVGRMTSESVGRITRWIQPENIFDSAKENPLVNHGPAKRPCYRSSGSEGVAGEGPILWWTTPDSSM